MVAYTRYGRKGGVRYTRPMAKAVIAKAIKKRNQAKAKSSVAKNSRAITTLTTKLNKVKIFNRGPIQSQLQFWSSGTHSPTANSPILHQVNDPVHNSNDVFHWNNITSATAALGHWNRNDDNAYQSTIHQFQDKVFLKYIEYEFKFSGYVVDTRLRIDVIRQKRLPRDSWSAYDQDEFLPHALGNFKNLAGFSQSYIHPKYFEKVMPTKYLYMNSQSSSSQKYNLYHSTDLDTDEGTPFQNTAMGPPTKYCRMRIPFNKFLRARDTTSMPTEDVDDSTPGYEYWRWNRAHPFEPVWMIISADTSNINGDGVKVDIHRKIVWQDTHN